METTAFTATAAAVNNVRSSLAASSVASQLGLTLYS